MPALGIVFIIALVITAVSRRSPIPRAVAAPHHRLQADAVHADKLAERGDRTAFVKRQLTDSKRPFSISFQENKIGEGGRSHPRRVASASKWSASSLKAFKKICGVGKTAPKSLLPS